MIDLKEEYYMDMKKLIVTMLVFAMLFVAPIASFAETTETVAVTETP